MTPKIKVAYLLNSTLPNSGATRSLHELLVKLCPLGVEPYFIVPDTNGYYATLQEKNIPTLVVNFRPHTYTYTNTVKDWLLFLPRMVARGVLNRRASRTIARWLEEEGVQLVHTNVGVAKVAYDAARKLSIPHVYHLREYGDKDFKMYYFPSHKALEEQLKTCHSISITRDICRYHCGKEGKNARVIYDGIMPERKIMPETPKERFLLFAGRVEPAKGVDFLLRAYGQYCRQSDAPLPLKIAGSTAKANYFARMKRIVEEENIGKYVEFLGERNDIMDLMQRALAIVIPSPSEGFGRCITEAMFNGCLAIGRNTAGTKEQLDNGLAACGEEIALRFETVAELALNMLAIERNPQGFSDMRNRAFKVVNSLYSSEISASKVYKYYQEILETPHNG